VLSVLLGNLRQKRIYHNYSDYKTKFSTPLAIFTETHRFEILILAFHLTRVRLHNKIMQATSRIIQNHENVYVCSTGNGEAEHRKYKRLKLGGGHVNDRSSV
jgi:hypothetical protein